MPQSMAIPYGGQIAGLSGMGDMSALLSQLQPYRPPDYTPPTLAKKALAGIADALMQAAVVKAGGTPREGANVGRQKAEEEANRQQTAQAEAATAQDRNRLVSDESRQRVAEERDAQRQQATADRQRADDERAARLASQQVIWGGLSKMAERGWQAPADLDPSAMSMDDFFRMQGEFYKQNGGERASLLAAGETIAEAAAKFPTLDFGAAVDEQTGKTRWTVSEHDPSKDKSAADAKQPGQMTEAQKANFARLTGRPDFGALPQAEREAIMARMGQDEKAWGKPLPQGLDQEYRGYLSIWANGLDIQSELTHIENTPGKAFATDADEAEFRAKANNLYSIIVKSRAGATQSEQEIALLKQFRVALGRLDRNNLAAIHTVINYYNQQADLIETSQKIPTARRQAMRATALGTGQPIGDSAPDPSRFTPVDGVQ